MVAIKTVILLFNIAAGAPLSKKAEMPLTTSTDGTCDIENNVVCPTNVIFDGEPMEFVCIDPINNPKPGQFWCVQDGMNLGTVCTSDCSKNSPGCLNKEDGVADEGVNCRGDLKCTNRICTAPPARALINP